MAAALPTLLLEAALKGAAVFLVVALATPLLRRRSAAVRHAAWSFAVCAQLALPALAVVAPAWRVPLVPPPAWAADLLGPHPSSARMAPADAGTVVSGAASTGAPPAPAAASGQGAGKGVRPTVGPGERVVGRLGTLRMVWLVGAGLILLHLALGTLGVWRLAVRGSRILDPGWLSLAHELAVRIGISRPLTLLRGDSLGVPVTWGVIYPVLLLPAGAESWDDEQRRYVLVHEMAHIRRFDALTHLVGQVTLAIFWFNPLVWLAVSRMRAERERACDDYVLRAGTTPSRYASDLLAMIRSIGLPERRSAAPAFAALAMARRSEFEGRMVSILDDETNRKPLSCGGLAGGAVAAAAVGLALAGFNPLAAHPGTPLASTAQRAPTPAGASDSTAHRVPARAGATDATPQRVPRSVGAAQTATTRRPVETRPLEQKRGSIDSVLAAMRPDGAKTAILAQYARSGDDALVAAAIRAVPSLSQDGQKSVVLAHAAPAALGGGDVGLRDAFFAALESITSDQDRTLVLVHAAANGRGSPAVTARVLRAAARMRSPEAASMVLINVAQRRLVTSDSLRALYLRAANALASEDDRQLALSALLQATRVQPPANP
ncbi:MAG: M56 family metallopeptidase [Longimicrobiaceae bacterium]